MKKKLTTTLSSVWEMERSVSKCVGRGRGMKRTASSSSTVASSASAVASTSSTASSLETEE